MRDSQFIVEMRNITKDFPGVRALEKVTFTCEKGQIRALIGENGAGKSTLMKILAGVYQPDGGEIFLKGERVVVHNPWEAQQLGISIVYQEFNLIPYLSVAENVFLGRESRSPWGFLDEERLHQHALEHLDRIQADLDPRRWVSELTVAQQQLVEIAKALSLNARILIMDEPTAALSAEEVERLFNIIRALKREGVTIVFISHRLKEVFDIADAVTVLKDGKEVGTRKLQEVREENLVGMMVGRKLNETFPPKSKGTQKKPILQLKGVGRERLLKDVNLSLYPGEIVGLAGLEGQGQRTLIRAVFGAEPTDQGEIFFEGKKINEINSPREAIKLGIGFIPSDRKEEGLILDFSVEENIALPSLQKRQFLGFIKKGEERKVVNGIVSEIDIKTPRIDREVRYLSGGNQQKVMLAKCLVVGPPLIILDEPTRGIDVGTKIEIYHLMRELAEQGRALLIFSTDMMEVLGMCDRILVMHEGGIVRELSGSEATEEEIMRAAAGLKHQKNSAQP